MKQCLPALLDQSLSGRGYMQGLKSWYVWKLFISHVMDGTFEIWIKSPLDHQVMYLRVIGLAGYHWNPCEPITRTRNASRFLHSPCRTPLPSPPRPRLCFMQTLHIPACLFSHEGRNETPSNFSGWGCTYRLAAVVLPNWLCLDHQDMQRFKTSELDKANNQLAEARIKMHRLAARS